MSQRAWAYIWGVFIVATALTATGLTDLAHVPAEWSVFAILTLLATAAQLFKAEAPNHVLFYASPVFFFAGALLLPPALIVPLVVVPHLIEWSRERWEGSAHLQAWYLQPFNVAMYTIAGLAAHWVYVALHTQLADDLTAGPVAVVLVAALTYAVLNHTILGFALVLARGVSWRDSGVFDTTALITDFTLLCVGFVVAALWPLNPWFIVPALAPLVLMYQALMIPKLKQEAQTDSKTGVFNAGHFNEVFTNELDRAQRFGRPLALIMADLDLLRDINNTYGHLAGDSVLAGIGHIMRATIRDYDVAGRFGGEEFALVLPEVTEDEARDMAERLRATVEAARFTFGNGSTPVRATLSLGIACFPDDALTTLDLTHAADVALYQAKARGRNRVVCSSDLSLSVREAHESSVGSDIETGQDRMSRDSISHQLSTTVVTAASRGYTDTMPDLADLSPIDSAGPESDPTNDEREAAESVHAGDHRGQPLKGIGWLLVGGVIATGIGMTILGLLPSSPWMHTPNLSEIALLTGLAVIAEFLQVDLYGRGTVSVSVGLTFTAALLTGIPGLACVSAAISLMNHVRQGRRGAQIYRAAFNWATHVLAGMAPVLLLGSDHLTLSGGHLPRLVALACGAGAAYYLIETGLVASAVSLTEGTSVIATWRSQYRWLAVHYLVLCLMALFAGVAYDSYGVTGALVFTLPVFLMHYVQKQYIRQSKESVVALQRLNRDLARAALTDHLTGVSNERAFQQQLRREIERAVRYGHGISLGTLDLDELKAVNEEHGHAHGDRVLAELARVLSSGRRADHVFRIAGDEFALILPHTTQEAAAVALNRLRRDVQERLGSSTVSIGVASLMPGEQDEDLLLERSSAALHAAKRRGRNMVVTFEDVKDFVSVTSSAQAHAVRSLLSEGNVSVAFQPIWDIDRSDVLAYEALARPSAEYGLDDPQQAFDIAEQLGRAHDLDALCREAALARAADLPQDSLLFINLSPATLDHDLLAGTRLLDAVQRCGLAPERVVLELTERSMARLSVVVQEAKRLRQLGFKLALDDTGAGNSGLEMLSQVPVDFIKIDRAIVADALTSRAARAVVAGIIAIAQEMDIYVIAEGIETPEMLSLVRELGAFHASKRRGVQGAQGYLLGRPETSIATGLSEDLQAHKVLIRVA